MKIGIDVRFALRSRRGIGNYILYLVTHLARIDHNHQYILYCDRPDKENILPMQDNIKLVSFGSRNYFIWEQVFLPLQALKDGVDILHCTSNTAPCFLNDRIRLITTIHDVMYFRSGEFVPKPINLYQKLGRIYRRLIVGKSIYRANKVITISQFSKDDILKLFRDIPPEVIEVVPEAGAEFIRKISVKADVLHEFGINGDYILALGAVDLRKNTEMILDVFLRLKRLRKIKEKLVIVGLANWKMTRFAHIVEGSVYKNDVIFLPFLSERELLLIYNQAKLFLYPSLYEGFGFPPLEAMRCGIPVISSNLTSIPEVTGEAALLVDPRNSDEIFEAILKILNDDKFRKALILKGRKQSDKYSWKKTAIKTLNIYNQVYRGEI